MAIKEPDWSSNTLTIGDLYHPAMKITSQRDATAYFQKLVDWACRVNKKKTRAQHIEIQKSNLGYFAGYYDGKTMMRVNKLFACVHPVFGATLPTPEEAFEAGKKAVTSGIENHPQPKIRPGMRTVITEK